MTALRAPTPPKGLSTAGKRLWRAVLGEFELDEHERLVLIEACRTSDRLDALSAAADGEPLVVLNARGDRTASPYLVEARQQSITLIRLLASLRLPSGDEADMTRPQRRGGARQPYGPRAMP